MVVYNKKEGTRKDSRSTKADVEHPPDLDENPFVMREPADGSSTGQYDSEQPRTAYTPLLFPALLFDWSITLTLTLNLSNFHNIILEKSAGSKNGVNVEFDGTEAGRRLAQTENRGKHRRIPRVAP